MTRSSILQTAPLLAALAVMARADDVRPLASFNLTATAEQKLVSSGQVAYAQSSTSMPAFVGGYFAGASFAGWADEIVLHTGAWFTLLSPTTNTSRLVTLPGGSVFLGYLGRPVCVTSRRTCYSAPWRASNLAEIDPVAGTARASSFTTGGNLTDVARVAGAGTDKLYLYAPMGHPRGSANKSLVVLDLGTGARSVVDLGVAAATRGPIDCTMTEGGGKLFMTSYNSTNLIVFDTRSNATTTLSVAPLVSAAPHVQRPLGRGVFCPSVGFVYFAPSRLHGVMVGVNAASLRVRTMPVPASTAYERAGDGVYSTADGTIYFTLGFSDYFLQFNPLTDETRLVPFSGRQGANGLFGATLVPSSGKVVFTHQHPASPVVRTPWVNAADAACVAVACSARCGAAPSSSSARCGWDARFGACLANRTTSAADAAARLGSCPPLSTLPATASTFGTATAQTTAAWAVTGAQPSSDTPVSTTTRLATAVPTTAAAPTTATTEASTQRRNENTGAAGSAASTTSASFSVPTVLATKSPGGDGDDGGGVATTAAAAAVAAFIAMAAVAAFAAWRHCRRPRKSTRAFENATYGTSPWSKAGAADDKAGISQA